MELLVGGDTLNSSSVAEILAMVQDLRELLANDIVVMLLPCIGQEIVAGIEQFFALIKARTSATELLDEVVRAESELAGASTGSGSDDGDGDGASSTAIIAGAAGAAVAVVLAIAAAWTYHKRGASGSAQPRRRSSYIAA